MSWNARRGLAVGAATVTAAITAGAFWLSYEHLHDVAADNGLPGVRAWAWPGVIDSFIVAGEILMLRASLRGGRFDWFACLLAAVGSTGSIALNVAGVGTGAAVMQYIVAAVPPSAALLAFAAVMRQIHGALAKGAASSRTPAVATALLPQGQLTPRPRSEVVPGSARLLPIVAAETTTEVTVERVEPEPEQPVGRLAIETGWRPLAWPQLPVGVTTAAPATATTTAATQAPRQVVTEVVTVTWSDLRKRARKLNAEVVRKTGRPVTIETLKSKLNVSRREATTLRREVVEGSRS